MIDNYVIAIFCFVGLLELKSYISSIGISTKIKSSMFCKEDFIEEILCDLFNLEYIVV